MAIVKDGFVRGHAQPATAPGAVARSGALVSSASHPLRRGSDPPPHVLVRRFGDALRVGDPYGVNAVVDDALQTGMSASAIHTRVIAPAMHRVGKLWEVGAISIADEHLATALSQQALALLYPRLLRRPSAQRGSAVVAAAPGEQHLLGLRMAADVLDGAGFKVRYVGAGVPAPVLEAWVIEHEPTVVVLGLTMSSGGPELLRHLQALHEINSEIRLVVGGQGVPPMLRDMPGLTYVSDTEGLVRAVEDVLTRPQQPLSPPLLVPGITESPGPAESLTGTATVEARLAAATTAAADATREHARRAFTLEQIAFQDPLTGLGNRRAFDDRYQEVADRGDGPPAALLMIDIDRFKRVNDGSGHPAGDRVLIDVAECITAALRDGDFAARYGGDEFAVLLRASSATDAVRVGERIRSLVHNELTDPPVSISVGATVAASADRRRVSMDADRALYDAKSRGRNRVAVV